MPDLIVEGLSKRFGEQQALDNVSFTVGDGEFFTLLGPSGCGKSTTLMSIAGLETPDTGSIRVGDHVFVDADHGTFLTPEERNLGMVFQSYALWPHMTVEANLAMPLKLRKVKGKEQTRLIDDALDQVGLLPYKKRYPHQLSGGQQQRVALARALVYSPTVLLLDEPLSNLDAKLRDRARAWLKDLQKTVGITTVYVTHDQLEALSLSDRLAVMSEGRMLQVAAPKEVYHDPSNAEVADFIGRCSFLSATVVEQEESGLTRVQLDGGGQLRVTAHGRWAAGQQVSVGIRSERMEVTPPRSDVTADSVNAIPAELRKASFVGARYEYELVAGDQLVFAESDREVSERKVWLLVPEDAAYVFSRSDAAQAEVPLAEVDA
ncbi:MAG TPA: ABC transporter ATP-binding protein [Segeticoccus sp.]|uniref:ABC transporter ATP-binding protein n=1 Tax=Segeticoccus sp. TaxID=2706531 RepID=UPI002D7FBF0A|nr:ABC transporter ATP-binding protein [Segeticoccus sp.]HET8601494.1 ABC transporter ATP-binding protein [Segeticoccus sp.]